MTLEILLRSLGGAVLVAANAFFVAVEFALTRLRGLGLDADDVRGQGLETAWELTERLEIHLTACQLGISSTSVLLGVVAEPAFTEALLPLAEAVGLSEGSVRPVSVVTGIVLLNLIHKIWGEQAPTYLGVERPAQVARALAPALKLWSTTMSPVVKLGDGLAKGTLRLFGVEVTRSWTKTEAEAPDRDGTGDRESPESDSRARLLRRIAGLLEEEEIPDTRRQEILQSVRIDDITLREIMVPAEEVVWLRAGDALSDHGRRIAEEGHTRYPVLEGDREKPGDPVRRASLAGILYVPALFRTEDWPRGDRPVPRDLLSQGALLPGNTSIADALDRLQEEGEEMALVVDPEDEDLILGLITVTDALEVVVGEIRDPLDPANGGD